MVMRSRTAGGHYLLHEKLEEPSGRAPEGFGIDDVLPLTGAARAPERTERPA